ncbi:hypothetical protein A3K86_07120 [Photobacterium jeanii]|uniref:Response regulatory domain-containing protein n=1 Tax=Photobacterium jeanii TaxID=858640 RepID=A0A178KMS4_9GAMM|nr:response regulator [Photobacterium jeanii]OAN18649.1 hypothetical protein A3K86_07120 [Photobacterium jeanii]PST91671.1 response regulator [Photobacterium jeanii]
MRQDNTVLVVDDCTIIQQTTKLILQNCGFNAANIHTATNAIDAIKACQTTSFDILFIDFNLGHGSTGLQLLEHLSRQQLLTHSPMVFVITAEDSTPVFMGFAEYEPDDYLIKPLRTDALQQRLQANFAQRQLNQLVQASFKEAGVAGAKAALQQAKSTKSFRQAITALCKQLMLSGEHSTAIALLGNFVTKHPYLPAQLLLAELYLQQQELVAAQQILQQLREQHPNHLQVLELSAKLALQNRQLTEALNYWQQAQQLSYTNLERQFTLFWLIMTTRSEAFFTRLREACVQIQHSIWDQPRYHALLFWGQIEQGVQHKKTLERQWLAQTQQKALSPEERGYIWVLKALQATKSDDAFTAYRYLQQPELQLGKELLTTSFEINVLLHKVYSELSMTMQKQACLQRLQQLIANETNATHRLLKQHWLARHISLHQQLANDYQDVAQLLDSPAKKDNGQTLLELWPRYRFDSRIAKQLIELFRQNLLPISHQQREFLMEARWTFEAQPEPPQWYQTLRQSDEAFHTPVQNMTTKATGSQPA